MYNPIQALPFALVLCAALAAAGCGQSSKSPETALTTPATETADAEAAAQAAADEAAAELSAREQELAAQQQELARREAELAEREALAQQAASARPASKPAPVARPPAVAKPAAPPPAPAPAQTPPPPPPPVTVAAGTELAVEFPAPLSTKTTSIGEPVVARLASDLFADGRRVAQAGSSIRGSVTESTSGSRKIGARPLLRVEFTELVLADGTTAAINARTVQRGASEKGRDTAKIAGGTAAGAILGHQIDDDKGKIIGGVLGGAAGAVAASKTGTEAEIPAGTVLPASVRTAFTYTGR